MSDAKKIGFIGGGNMAEAIIKGLLAGGVRAGDLCVAEPLSQRRDYLAQTFAVRAVDDNQEVARLSEVLVLAIKPQLAANVLATLEPSLSTETLVISIMAGVSTAFIEESLSAGVRVVRAMPNTPAMVQAAATAICPGRKSNDNDLVLAGRIFSSVGSVVTISEKQMDAVTGLSGSGPAYVFSFLEALADAGVKNGLARDVAFKLAVQTVLGAARLVDETGEHPALLKEKVTSPGGTTITGLHTLENGRFHGLVMDAVDSACRRSRELSGK